MRKKNYEKLTKVNIAKVISLLEQEKPITKKEACEILNINYNTTRLNNIIQDYKEDEARTARFKAEKKGKPATKDEIKAAVQSYISGETISDIASGMYRSPAFVKAIIERVGVPMKHSSEEYNWKEVMLPEQCVSDKFEVGEVVWCLRENCPAIIQKEWNHPEGDLGYTMYTIECTDLSETLFPHLEFAGRYVNARAHNIGCLRHLEEYGVNLRNFY